MTGAGAPPAPTEAPVLLSVEDLSKSFGSLRAVQNVSLQIPEGEALGIIGPNGAGKSTLFNLITGVLPADAGRIRLAGRDVTRDPPQRRCHAGIGRSFQVPQPFENLTVFENLLVAATNGRQRSEREAGGSCAAVLERAGLIDLANRPAGSLTLLQRKQLELARALATEPQLLLLDEIAGGLTEAECNALVETIKEIHASGVTIVWIEHIVHALIAVVGRLLVLDFGEVIAAGEPRAIMDSPKVREIYMGIEV
jgi:branched-chain amino acid transport system ATP-binding protein